MAEGTAEVAPEGEEGAGHLLGEVQEGELLQTFDEHRGLLCVFWKNMKEALDYWREPCYNGLKGSLPL
jgi:hypothetical protein